MDMVHATTPIRDSSSPYCNQEDLDTLMTELKRGFVDSKRNVNGRIDSLKSKIQDMDHLQLGQSALEDELKDLKDNINKQFTKIKSIINDIYRRLGKVHRGDHLWLVPSTQIQDTEPLNTIYPKDIATNLNKEHNKKVRGKKTHKSTQQQIKRRRQGKA